MATAPAEVDDPDRQAVRVSALAEAVTGLDLIPVIRVAPDLRSMAVVRQKES